MIDITKLNEAQQKALAKLPPAVRQYILENPGVIKQEKQARDVNWPLKNMVPNIAQIRSMMCYSEPHPTYPGGYPFLNIFRGGNGVGKTCALSILLVGVCYGNKFLNSEYFNHQYFDDCEEIRKKRPLLVRLVGKKADFEDTGSLYQEIRKWIPLSRFEGKVATYYTKLILPAQGPGYKPVTIDLKTFDMDIVSFAGPTLDLILYNEPPPEDIYGENVGRCRAGGRMAAFLTPIDQAAYLHKIETGVYPDGEIHVTQASIWDNCKDIPGTNGILTRSDIERMIRQWKSTNPLEVPARENGQYMHLTGSIYPGFNKSVHVIKPIPLQPNWNYYKVTDPHNKKPPFCVIIAVAPTGVCYVVAEYPTDNWESVTRTEYGIRQHVTEIKRIQNGQNLRFYHIKSPIVIDKHYGDPNKFPEQQPNSAKTLKQEYEEAGCEEITVKGINDDIMFGHEKVTQLLYYDRDRELKFPNTPQIYIFDTCRNVAQAFQEFRYKKGKGLMGSALSEVIDPTWECPMACIRYFAVMFKGYIPKVHRSGRLHPDVQALDRRRNIKYISSDSKYAERVI